MRLCISFYVFLSSLFVCCRSFMSLSTHWRYCARATSITHRVVAVVFVVHNIQIANGIHLVVASSPNWRASPYYTQYLFCCTKPNSFRFFYFFIFVVHHSAFSVRLVIYLVSVFEVSLCLISILEFYFFVCLFVQECFSNSEDRKRFYGRREYWKWMNERSFAILPLNIEWIQLRTNKPKNK